jgi:hypothetical protein
MAQHFHPKLGGENTRPSDPNKVPHALVPDEQQRHRFKFPSMPRQHHTPHFVSGDHPPTYAQELIHWILTLLHLVVVLAAVVVSCWTAAFALNQTCNTGECKAAAYVTNTFYSTRKLALTVAGWPVASERPGFEADETGSAVLFPGRPSFATAHYYTCMQTAQVGNSVCPAKTDQSVTDYIGCLNNNTGTRAVLDACSPLTVSWPTAEDYLQCIFAQPVMRHTANVHASERVFRSCLDRVMWPLYEVQQSVDSTIMFGSYNWLVLLVVGLLCMTSFGVYTASPWEHGKVMFGDPDWHMRLGALWISVSLVWNITFLVFFFVVAARAGTDAEGDDAVPTTATTSVLSVAFITLHVAYFLFELVDGQPGSRFFVHVWKCAGMSGHLKDHNAGEMLRSTGQIVRYKRSPAALGVSMPRPHVKVYDISPSDVAMYYTPPLLSAWADGYLSDPLIFLGVIGATGHVTTPHAFGFFFLVLLFRLLNCQIARYMYQCFMNNLSFTNEENEAYHNINTIPGAFFHAHSASAQHHHAHAQLVIKHDTAPEAGGEPAEELPDITSAFQLRTFPSGRMGTNGTDTERHHLHVTTTTTKPAEPHLNIQVMALSTQISNFFILAAVLFLVFDGDTQMSEVWTLKLFVILGFIVPESIRIITHLVCQVWPPNPNSVPWKLLNIHMFIWVWDLAVRLVFVAYIVLSLSAVEGTRRFLFEKRYQLLDYTLPLLGA